VGAAKKPKSEFLCDVFYSNHLPDIPFEPKLIKIYLPNERLHRYCGASLEQSLRIPFVTDKYCGMALDLLHPSLYARPHGVKRGDLHADDRALLPQGALKPGQRAQPTQMQLFEQGSMNWLRKQELQLNNLYEMNIRTIGAAEARQREVQRVEELKKKAMQEDTREKQIELIEKTFELAKQTPVHPSKKDVSIVSIQSIFPELDFQHHDASNGEGEVPYEHVRAKNVARPIELIDPFDPRFADLDEESQAEQRALYEEWVHRSMFNVEYSWVEYDFPPLDEPDHEKKDEDATLMDTAVDSKEKSQPVSTEEDERMKAVARRARLRPLLQSYSTQYHGFYVHDPAQAAAAKSAKEKQTAEAEEKKQKEKEQDESGTAMEDIEEGKAAATETSDADPNVLSEEVYNWKREYVKVPTPRVDASNNYFLISRKQPAASTSTFTGPAASAPNPPLHGEIFYAQYTDRMRLAKRTKTRIDKAFDDIHARPAAIHVQYVKEYKEKETVKTEEEEEEEGGEEEEEEARENEEDEEAEAEAGEDEDEEEEEEEEEDAAEASASEEEKVKAESGEGEEEEEEAAAKEKLSKREKKRLKKEKKEKKRSKKEKKEKKEAKKKRKEKEREKSEAEEEESEA